MPTIDLPAHNVAIQPGYTNPALLVGGPEALASTAEDTYLEFSDSTGGFMVGSTDGIFTDTLGFGYWEPPGTVTDARYVAHGYRAGGGIIPPDSYHISSYTQPVPETWPVVMLEPNGPTFSYFNITPPAGDVAEVLAGYPLPLDITTSQGPDGLKALVFIDTNYPPELADVTVRLTYLAIRVTYGGKGPRLRKHPISPLRQWPAERYYGRSNRRAGGYK